MNFRLYHDLTFDALYGCILVLVYVILERTVYLTYLSLRMRRLAILADADGGKGVAALRWRDPATRAVQRYIEALAKGASRERQEDYSSALFIGFDKKV